MKPSQSLSRSCLFSFIVAFGWALPSQGQFVVQGIFGTVDTVTVSNSGESPATGVVISDTAQGLHAGGLTIPVGGQVSYSYGVTVDDGPQTAMYTATLASDQTAAQQAVLALDVQNVLPVLSASQSATAIDEVLAFSADRV